MNASGKIFVCGIGAVSPAGWGVSALREAIAKNEPLPTKEIERPGWAKPLHVRQVPPQSPRPSYSAHPRMRRSSPISHYTVSAALEALGEDAENVKNGSLKLGIILCTLAGSLNYCRRFYDETLRDPQTASPLVFPETVFNAPSSHLASLLGTNAINYTLVGDPGTFVQGLALAANWLVSGRLDGCVVVGAEEMDWPTADAFRLFQRSIVMSDGAGALYLRREPANEAAIELECITDPHLFANKQTRSRAASRLRADFPSTAENHLLCDGLQGLPVFDKAEQLAWRDWTGPRLSPKRILGEGSVAGAALQCVAAIDALAQNPYAGAYVSVVGSNQQAIGAHFARATG